MVHKQRFFIGGSTWSSSLFLCKVGGGKRRCTVLITPTGSLDSASVLLLSSILPAVMSFTSLTLSGIYSESLGHWEMIFSLREETVIDGLYLLGPMSVPSASLNLSSIQSSLPIFLFSPPKQESFKNEEVKTDTLVERLCLWAAEFNLSGEILLLLVTLLPESVWLFYP